VKLFQIEEPDGGPADPSGPGAAIGIDAGSDYAEVAFSVGGNAVLLEDRPGFEQPLPIPPSKAGIGVWRELFEGVRIRAERALARPVTHAVIALVQAPDAAAVRSLRQAAELGGLDILRLAGRTELSHGPSVALAAALLAEDLAPRPEPAAAPDPG